MATFDDFAALDIRVGEIVESGDLAKARKPAYTLKVYFGEEIGTRQTSAQITRFYDKEELIGKRVLAVVNFPSKLIAGFRSEILVLGVYHEDGVVLITPDKEVALGEKLG